jgi:hypothetical protein
MRAFVIVSALFAVSSIGTAALAHEGVDREPVSRPHVVREHIARERVAREHVSRDHVVRERVTREHAPRPDMKVDRVARPAEERGDRGASSGAAKASASRTSAPVPATIAAIAAPRVNCDPGSDGCATPRSSAVEKRHGASVAKSTSSKDAPKVDKATSEALKRIVLAHRCKKDADCSAY